MYVDRANGSIFFYTNVVLKPKQITDAKSIIYRILNLYDSFFGLLNTPIIKQSNTDRLPIIIQPFVINAFTCTDRRGDTYTTHGWCGRSYWITRVRLKMSSVIRAFGRVNDKPLKIITCQEWRAPALQLFFDVFKIQLFLPCVAVRTRVSNVSIVRNALELTR